MLPTNEGLTAYSCQPTIPAPRSFSPQSYGGQHRAIFFGYFESSEIFVLNSFRFDTSYQWVCLYSLCYTVRRPCYTRQRVVSVSVTAQYLLVPKVRMIFVTSVDFENDKSIFFHSATMLVSATPSFLQSSAFPKSRLKFWAVLFYVCLDPRS